MIRSSIMSNYTLVNFTSVLVLCVFLTAVTTTGHVSELNHQKTPIVNTLSREARAPPSPPHNPSHQTANFLNALLTNSLAIHSDFGIGIRWATGDTHQANHPDLQKPSSSSIHDRYIGSNIHIGGHLHNGRLGQGQQGISHHVAGTSLATLGDTSEAKNDEDIKRSDIQDNYAPEPAKEVEGSGASWPQRFRNYLLTWTRAHERSCTTKEGHSNIDSLNCTETTITSHPLIQWFTRHIPKDEEPRDQTRANETIFDKIKKFYLGNKFPLLVNFTQVTTAANSSAQVRDFMTEVDSLRSTIRSYVADMVSVYLAKNTTNEQFIRNAIKRNLLQWTTSKEEASTNLNETTKNIKIEEALSNRLASVFSMERIKKVFPEIDTLRQSLLQDKDASTPTGYSTWFARNFSPLISKYQLKEPYLATEPK